MHLLFGLNIDEWISFAFWWITWGLIAWGLIEVIFQSGWTVGSFRCLDRGVSGRTPNVYSKKIRRFRSWNADLCQTNIFIPGRWTESNVQKRKKKCWLWNLSSAHSFDLKRKCRKKWVKEQLTLPVRHVALSTVSRLQLREVNCRSSKSLSWAILSTSTLVFFLVASI